MNANTKRTLIVVGASTAIGFLGDIMTYSVAASKGGPMRVVSPRGKELLAVILLGIVGGFIIDYTLKAIEHSLKSEEELSLDDLVEKERKKIILGEIKNEIPSKVLWVKPQTT